MKKILKAIVFWVIAAVIAYSIRYTEFAYIGYMLTLAAQLYFIYAIIIAVWRLIRPKRNTASTATPQPINLKDNIKPAPATRAKAPAKKSKTGWVVLLLLLIVLIIALRRPLGYYGYRGFIFLDNFFKLGNNSSPVFSWAFFGLLMGIVYGCFVAGKKYKLSRSASLISIGAFIVFMVGLFFINEPLGANSLSTLAGTKEKYAFDLVNVSERGPSSSGNRNNSIYYINDNNYSTAWIKDVKELNKPEIAYTFSMYVDNQGSNARCVGFMIENGNRKSAKAWNGYSRLESFSIWKDGALITEAVASDSNDGLQEIKIDPVPVKAYDVISIKLTSVYPGAQYPKTLAISELVPIIQYDENVDLFKY